jgi:hypothetical protein
VRPSWVITRLGLPNEWIVMAKRPTAVWREGIEEDARLVATGETGETGEEFAVAAQLFPDALLNRFDDVFNSFERSVEGIDRSDEAVMRCVEGFVLTLNALQEEFDGDAIATGERDLICEYIDNVITEAGVDLDALCVRRGISRDELTDDWRIW